MSPGRVLPAALLALLLQACASPVAGVAPGMSREAVAALWGESRASYALPDGQQRLFYDRQRDGSQRQALDFDAEGRLLRSQEALGVVQLRGVTQPPLRTHEVLQRLGPPASQAMAADAQDKARQTAIWVYRFQEQGRYRLASILFNAAGLAETVQFTDDPADSHQDQYR